MENASGGKVRGVIGIMLFGVNLFIGAVGLFFAFTLGKLAIAKGVLMMEFAAAGFGLAAALVLADAVLLLTKRGSRPMPTPMSSRRPLVWAAIIVVVISLALFTVVAMGGHW